jgi:DNA-binding CsgD family transcriptional regulator/PAS domain-containing protein
MAGPSEVAALLHAGLIDRHAWLSGLTALTDMLEAHHLLAVAAQVDDDKQSQPVMRGARLTEEQLDVFASSSAEIRQLSAQMEVGRAIPTEIVIPNAIFYRTKVYHEAVRPAGGHYSVAARPTRSTLVVACRPQTAESFSRAHVQTLQSILPTLEATFPLKSRLEHLEQRASMLERALDEVGDLGILLLDQRGFVVHLNRAAERIIQAEDGLYWKRGELVGARDADTHRLRRTLCDGSGKLCALSRPSSRRPLVTRAISINSSGAERLQEIGPTRTLLFVRNPDKAGLSNFDLVAATLGLTRREARLAALLAQGRSVAEAADEIGITIGNARTHLKRIFSKTDTHRQAELVRVLFQARP